MSAIETMLAGLIDYAGLYPPAALDMRAAVRNYLEYSSGKHAFALGRFIVDAARLDELREAAGTSFSRVRVSAIVPATASSQEMEGILHAGLPIESLEIKCSEPLTICRISERLPLHIDRYFEIPLRQGCSGAIDAIASVGACAKLRMGGVFAEAFPPPDHVVECLRLVADRCVPSNAPAGLPPPIRSCHRLTYAADSPSATMHGFVNFFCAAGFVYAGDSQCAKAVLEDED